jgi:hypothetical protein
MREYVILADLAKRRDAFGVMIMKDVPVIVPGTETIGTPDRIVHKYQINHIEKYDNIEYHDMAGRLVTLCGNSVLVNNSDLVVDGTGVGEPTIEIIRRKGVNPIPILFTGGEHAQEIYESMGNIFTDTRGQLRGINILKEIRVPKKDLVDAGMIILQQGRLEIAQSKWRDEFVKQLSKFRGKVNESSKRVRYEAEAETDHDDLVVCYLMGAWWLTNRKERDDIPERALEKTAHGNDWDPFDFI